MFGEVVDLERGRVVRSAGETLHWAHPSLSYRACRSKIKRLEIRDVDLDVRRARPSGWQAWRAADRACSCGPARDWSAPVAGSIHRQTARPDRQELPPVQDEGRGLRAGLPAGGGPHPRPTLTEHSSCPEEAGPLHRPGERQPGWQRSASRSTTSRGRRQARWNRSPAATSSGRCWRSAVSPGAGPAGAPHPRPGHRIGDLMWTKLKERCDQGGASSSPPPTWTNCSATATGSWCSSPAGSRPARRRAT